MEEVKAFAEKIGYEVVAGEGAIIVYAGDDCADFSADQDGLNDVMDVLQHDAEVVSEEL